MFIPRDMQGRDYDAWFNRAFILIRGEVCLYDHYEDGVVCGSDHYGEQLYADAEDVEYFWPECGCVNAGDYAIYVERRQSRQWRRAFSMREVNVYYPDKWEIMKAKVVAQLNVSDFGVAIACHNPEYLDMGVAGPLLDAGARHSIALSQHVIVAGAAPERRVYLRNELVGVIRMTKPEPMASMAKARRVLKTLGGSYGL